jgi:hypothetical protein
MNASDDQENENQAGRAASEELRSDNSLQPTSQLPKERLAFVSGNILVFALLFVKLWPAMTSYQTGVNLHAWTFNTPGQGVKPAIWIFWFVTLILSTMASALILAVFHIICWGIWLGLSGELDEIQTRPEAVLARLCETSYGAVFFLSSFIIPLLVLTSLVLLSVGFEQVLATRLHLSPRLSGWIARTSLALFLGVTAYRIVKRLFKKLERSPATLDRFVTGRGPFKALSLMLSIIIIVPAWLILIEACYTLDLSLNKQLVVQKADEALEIYVSLGGGTSSDADADLKLMDSSGSVRKNLRLQDLGEGKFLSYLNTSELSEGRYQVVLEYPHTALTDSFPYLSSTTRKTRWFVVRP